MAAAMIPEGFVLEKEPQGIPDGFVLEQPSVMERYQPTQKQMLAQTATHQAPPMSRETRATRELPELGFSGLLSGEPMAATKVAGAMALGTGPQEMAKILQASSPNIKITQDEGGNLIANNIKTGAKAVIDMPGITPQSVLQFGSTAAMFTPAGFAAQAPARAGVMELGKAALRGGAATGATEAVAQAGQKMLGGEFDADQVGIATGLGALLPPIQNVFKKTAGLVTDRSKKLIQGATPTTEGLKEASRNLYQQIDETGSVIKSNKVKGLYTNLNNTLRKEGYIAQTNPKIQGILKALNQTKKGNVEISYIDSLRKSAGDLLASTDPADRRLGGIITGKLDDFIDDLKYQDFLNPQKQPIGELYKDARELWNRARKSEIIDDAVSKAELQSTGFENGLRIQFRSILNNKKLSRKFTNEELSQMRKVVQGGPLENTLKLLGRFGFMEGQRVTALIPLLGIGAGSMAGGPGGAVAVPMLGQFSRNLAQRMTRNNAKMASQLIRAGNNGKDIVKTYLSNTTRKERNASELAELLIANKADLIKLKEIVPKTKLNLDAILIASMMQSQEED